MFEDFLENFLETISGQAGQDLTQQQIEAAQEVAIAQTAADVLKNSPEAIAERRKLILGVLFIVVLAGLGITYLYFRYFK